MGHKYWSSFAEEKQKTIEERSQKLYQLLFEPEVDAPIKTLDLPLGGGAGIRTTLKMLVEFVLIASRDQKGIPARIEDQSEDVTGDGTILVLNRSLRLAERITGNDNGSLGLHPAVYFYGPSGTHIGSLFMGVATLIAQKLINNDNSFFMKFTKVRKQVEDALVMHKRLLAAIIVQTRSAKRYETIAALIVHFIDSFTNGSTPTEQEIVRIAGVEGRIIIGDETERSTHFSDETRSAAFLREALSTAMHCPICSGYLDPKKSVSYDHVTPVREGGKGTDSNCQLAHPYCNQAYKN